MLDRSVSLYKKKLKQSETDCKFYTTILLPSLAIEKEIREVTDRTIKNIEVKFSLPLFLPSLANFVNSKLLFLII